MKKKSIAAKALTPKKLSAISTNVNAKPSKFNSKAVLIKDKESIILAARNGYFERIQTQPSAR